MNCELDRWIDRNTLLELLKEVPQDAILRPSPTGNLIFQTDRLTGFIDWETESVQTVPDRPD